MCEIINDKKNKNRKNKITPEMAIAINGIPYDKEKHISIPLFYEALGKQFGISTASVRIIKSEKLDNKSNVQGVERLRRLTLIKPVTEAIANELVTAMYEEYFNKKPEYLSAIDRYGVMQIVIRPEMIFFQIDERHLTNLDRFTQMAICSFKDAVRNYETNLINRKKREV